MPSPVVTAARPNDPQRSEHRILAVGGAILLGLAGLFLWSELQVPVESLAVVLSLAGGVGAVFFTQQRFTLVGPLTLLAGTGAVGLWYGATREPALLLGLLVLFVAGLVLVKVESGRERAERAVDRTHRLLAWHTLAISGLVTSFAAYFHIFDASDLSLQGFVARRVILTLGWLFTGTALVLLGRRHRTTEVRDAGFLVLATAFAKMLAYDLTHVDGALRIGALAIGGVTLLAAAEIARRLNGARV